MRHLLIFISISFLALLASCEKAQKSTAPHEWLVDDEFRCHFVPKEQTDDGYQVQAKINNFITPTILLSYSDWPEFIDDLDFGGMSTAIQRQLKQFEHVNLNGTIRLGRDVYSLKQVKKSLLEFKNLINEFHICQKGDDDALCYQDFSTALKQKFNLYKPDLKPGDSRYGEKKPTLFTGYYTPLMNVSTRPTSRYPYAIYGQPVDIKDRSFTRNEIDFKGAIEDIGADLFYANNLFDLYLMQIEGGGHIRYKDRNGKVQNIYLSYNETNHHAWTFISKYMLTKNYIQNQSIVQQREFLNKHPERQEEIFSTCPGYVYFKKTHQPPVGSAEAPLTDNRSIATDKNYYKFKGVLSFVVASRPEEPVTKPADCKSLPFSQFSRFFLDQDTGGSIKGKARVDLYFGEGPYAELAASNTVVRGDLYFLMLKLSVQH